jgi:hypothetical protein
LLAPESPLACAPNLTQACGHTTARIHLRLRRFSVAEDCARDVVEVVGDSARQGTDGLHAARLLQIRFASQMDPSCRA